MIRVTRWLIWQGYLWVRRHGRALLVDLWSIALACVLILQFMHASHTASPHMPAPSAGLVVCGNASILDGPSSPPPGATTVPAGDNSALTPNFANPGFSQPNTTWWFAPGVHTIGNDQFAQIQPGNNTTFIGAPGAIIDGQSLNHYAFTGTLGTNVDIEHLTIENFGIGSSASTPSGDNPGQGVVNGDGQANWTMKYDTMRYDAGAGLFVGTNGIAEYDCLTQDGEYGFQTTGGSSNVLVANNEVSYNNTWDYEAKNPGCGCSGADKFWDSTGVTVTGNYIHNNKGSGIWPDTDNSGFDIENNYVSDNDGEALIYEISYNLKLVNNTFVRNAIVQGPLLGGFPLPAVYISESGFDSRAPNPFGFTGMDITGNTFIDNWGGVVLWENADRYCSSGANTSTGYCTEVNPTVSGHCSTPGTQQVYPPCECASATIVATTPYIDDCRWKTQNANISGNLFQFNPLDMGPSCTVAHYCGFNGIFSQYGSIAPFVGTNVEDNITYHQNNLFSNNTYLGPWHYDTHEQGNVSDFATWQAAPSSQDTGSTFTPIIPAAGTGTGQRWPGPMHPPVVIPGRSGRH